MVPCISCPLMSSQGLLPEDIRINIHTGDVNDSFKINVSCAEDDLPQFSCIGSVQCPKGDFQILSYIYRMISTN